MGIYGRDLSNETEGNSVVLRGVFLLAVGVPGDRVVLHGGRGARERSHILCLRVILCVDHTVHRVLHGGDQGQDVRRDPEGVWHLRHRLTMRSKVARPDRDK